jgi:predicted transcriptional regulator
MEDKYVVLGRIFASKNRLNILLSLSEALKTPSGLSTDLDLHLSCVSKILGELAEMKLVECKNQRLVKGRIYGLTKLGQETVQEIKHLEIGKKEESKVA